MNETLQSWHDSPARRLTSSRYLPDAVTKPGGDGNEHIASHNLPPSMDDEEVHRRLDSIVDIVNLSGVEMGRNNLQRVVYIRAMGANFASVDSLFRARQLSGLIANLGDIDISTQDQEVKDALVDDIRELNVLQERSNGRVDPERLAAMIARLRRQAQQVLAQDDADEFRRTAAAELLQDLPEVDDALAETHKYEASPELMAEWEPRIRKKYADFIALVSEDKTTYSRDELKELFESAVATMRDKWQLDNAADWSVQFGGTNINVDSENKTIWIPEKTAETTSDRALQLLIHEFGGHLLRNLLGEKTDDPFYATSLPGRSADEEALYALLQTTVSSKPRFSETGAVYYVGAGLGLGILRDGDALSPEGIERVLTNMSLINPNNTEARAHQLGTNNTSRLVRGMPSIVIDGKLHQAIHTDQLKYALGQQHAVEWLRANRDNPTALDLVAGGKFAYSDEAQVAYGRHLYETKIQGRFAVPSAA